MKQTAALNDLVKLSSPTPHASEKEMTTSGSDQVEATMTRREWAIVFLLVVSALINYVDRSNLSIAAPAIQRQFSLSPIQIGSILSAFFWTYALMQISGIAGWFTDHFPVGWVMLGGYVLWSGATVITGFTSSYAGLFVALLLLGIGESVAYPCYSRVFAELPQHQRGRANALIDAGTKLGPAVGAFLGGLLVVYIGWRMLFIVLGAGGTLWVFPWIRVMPHYERRVDGGNAPPLPSIARLLRVKSAWGTFLGHFCGNYFLYFQLTWLPIYLVREEKLSIGSMSRLASGVFLLIACSTLVTGWISDRLIAAGASPTRVRKNVVVGGLTVASSLLLLAFTHGNLSASVVIMTVACIGYGAFASNHWAISQTLAGPAMAGRWTSMQNGIANLAGIVAPWVAGAIVQISGNSRMAFFITGSVAIAGASIWALFVGTVEPVQWGTERCAQESIQ